MRVPQNGIHIMLGRVQQPLRRPGLLMQPTHVNPMHRLARNCGESYVRAGRMSDALLALAGGPC